ncbi:hypothetical protein J7L06_02735 [Candidatus Bathyarchaeota archaeon]|nr:hypothetical protein [Candidatus Bathyarchaeota archaeon]
MSLPAKGYESVNLPTSLYRKVKSLIESRSDLGYRSVTEFVTEAVRRRAEEIERSGGETDLLNRIRSLLENP